MGRCRSLIAADWRCDPWLPLDRAGALFARRLYRWLEGRSFLQVAQRGEPCLDCGQPIRWRPREEPVTNPGLGGPAVKVLAGTCGCPKKGRIRVVPIGSAPGQKR